MILTTVQFFIGSAALTPQTYRSDPSAWNVFSVLLSTEIEDMEPKMSKVFQVNTQQRVACRPPRGKPSPDVWWERDGQRIPTEGRVFQDGLNLVFNPTMEGDSGVYTCVAQNKAGRRTQEATVTVASKSLAHRLWWTWRKQTGGGKGQKIKVDLLKSYSFCRKTEKF